MKPDAMRCEGCGQIWYSRVAAIIVAQPDLARCVRCQGSLVLHTQHPGASGDTQLSEPAPRGSAP